MSSNLPPAGPPSGPPVGPPVGPPSGPPPSFGTPELLDSGAGGGQMPPSASTGGSGGGGRRKGLILGGGIVGLAAAAGGAFAVYQLAFATGPQPAEALPASTVGYVSVDLDPSGKQKIEALETLNKFPAFQDNVDLDSDDDLRQKLFELAVEDIGVCSDLDFGDDVEPWLGDRFGLAAVDVGEDLADNPTGIVPAGVIQVTDADQAEEALTKVQECLAGGSGDDQVYESDETSASAAPDDLATDPAGDEDGADGADQADESDVPEPFGWSVQGDWVVVSFSDEVAEAITEAAQDDPLSDDDGYQQWTEAAGDPGILTAYLSAEAPALFTDLVGGFAYGGSVACASEPALPAAPGEEFTTGPDDDMSDPYTDPYTDYCTEDGPDATQDEATEALEKSFEGFEGAAVTVRFDDGGLEVESATGSGGAGFDILAGSDRGDDVVTGLPGDTAIAVGVGFEDGWFTSLTDYISASSGGLFDLDEALAEIEAQTGLQLPEDAETLAGESAAIAIGGDVDFSAPTPEDQPVGVKVQGDPDAITPLVDQLLGSAAADDLEGFGYDTDGEHVAGAFSDEWTAALLGDGDLGDDDLYQDVVDESDDASAVLFVDFDKGGWLERAVEDDDELLANLEVLEAAGMSVWTDDDDVSHSSLKITTD